MTTVQHTGTAASLPRHASPPKRRRWRLPAPAVLVVIYSGAAAVLSLWWRHTPAVVGVDGWLTGAGRITGLLAGYTCAVLLLLMARIPALDRGVGTDRLARWHAIGGRYTVGLALAHTLLIIWGYSVTSTTGVVDQTTTLVLRYPDMLKGTIGLILFVVVGGVSARAARRRLSYETWYYLHFCTYLAVCLAFFHQLSNGADFVADRPARVAWYTLYLGTAALLLRYRLLSPLLRALRHRPRVAEVRREAPGVVSVYLTGRNLDRLGAEAGQFFRWRFLTPGMWWTANPFSLSAPPDAGYLRITVKEAGGHSRAVARLRPGTRVWAEGPYGGFTAARRSRSKVLLLAGGVGITPLRALFETLHGEVTLLYYARREEDLALRGELDEIAAVRGTRVLYAVGEGALPLTAESLCGAIGDLAEHEVYLCGPPGMTAAAKDALRDAGVPRRHIHHESFEF
ncbi:ferric reductase-like transmembrane domain-containing protein [Streptomyces sp. NPDC060064]|uniref:ferredoxin reductase family protein n=1 Tax=Streptomyces sp. NPDC060064 TaxID=3347049 RepID=UPI003679D085